MSRDDVKRGQMIAENIRKTLLNADLRLAYAETERKLAHQDFKLYSKLGGGANVRRALRAKARRECYKIYIDNINKIKADLTVGLDAILSHYTPRYKRVWAMYFIEERRIEEICREIGYSRENVNKIIQKLKLDLSQNYGGNYNESERTPEKV